MNPEIEELRRKRDEAEKKIELLEHKSQQLMNRIHYYQEGERKARAHRLIERGGTVESIWPEVKTLTKEDFTLLMRRVLSLPEAKAELRNLLGSDH